MVGALKILLLASEVLSCNCLNQGEVWPRRSFSWAEVFVLSLEEFV